MASLLPGLRRAAPRLSQEFFSCRQTLSNPRPFFTARPIQPLRPRFVQSKTVTTVDAAQKSSTLGSLSREFGKETSQAAPQVKGFFPTKNRPVVAYWLFGSAASVFGLVIFGGLTRLTESGLSITEWKPVTGSIWPPDQEAWQAEYDKYRLSPEFKQLNSNMDLEDFKKIYFMEWTHRQWGRFVGLSFVLPAAFFVARRMVTRNMSVRLLGIASLIGFQGFIGWWMVKSGLKDDLFAPGAHPRVSQYRLAAHLGTAFICYSAMLWNGLAILRDRKLHNFPEEGLKNIQRILSPSLSAFRKTTLGLTALIFVTAMSGALVAGLDAGLIYNEFPKMGLGYAPPKKELFDEFYCRREDKSDLWWRNMLENPSLVQLDHRILAMTTFFSVLAFWAWTKSPRLAAALPRNAKKGALGLVHLVSLQAILGISTLIYMVPTHLAATHQAGALALLTGGLVLSSRIWVPRSSMRIVNQALKRKSTPPQHLKPPTRQ